MGSEMCIRDRNTEKHTENTDKHTENTHETHRKHRETQRKHRETHKKHRERVFCVFHVCILCVSVCFSVFSVCFLCVSYVFSVCFCVFLCVSCMFSLCFLCVCVCSCVFVCVCVSRRHSYYYCAHFFGMIKNTNNFQLLLLLLESLFPKTGCKRENQGVQYLFQLKQMICFKLH